MNAKYIAVMMACMLVASYGCRCGTVNGRDPENDVIQGRPPPNKSARLDAIKVDILGKLGMSKEPVVSPNQTIEETRKIIKMYRKNVLQLQGKVHSVVEDESQKAKQFNTYSSSQNDRLPARFKAKNEGGLYFFFNVDIGEPDNPNKEIHVTQATLRFRVEKILRENLRPDDRQFVNVHIYQVTPHASSGRTNRTVRYTKRLITSHQISTAQRRPGSWQEVNVASSVQEWIRDPGSNHGLIIDAGDRYRRLDDIMLISPSEKVRTRNLRTNTTAHARRRHKHKTMTSSIVVDVRDSSSLNDTNAFSPALNVYSRARKIKTRTKRFDEKLDCASGDGETRCCRYPLWVSFKDIGWDSWIFEPKGYQAYFCDGACPHKYKVAHRFSGIKSLVNSISPASTPGPCCSATKLSSISLAHYNAEGHAVISVFEDMIVDECKCT